MLNSLPIVENKATARYIDSYSANKRFSIMSLSIIAAIAYGVLAVVGGIIGYVQAQSKASLISGSISGLLLIIAGVMQLQGQAAGLTLATVITAVLVIVFAIRLTKTRKFMPAGLMSLLGLVSLGLMVSELLKNAPVSATAALSFLLVPNL